MMDFLSNLEYWHWLAIALVFFIIEMLAPGAVFIWFGAAAAAIGIIMLVVSDISWQAQIILFSLLSVASLIAWRMYTKKNPPSDNQYPTLNKRGEDLVGRVFTLEEAIVNNYGKIKVDDTMWKIRGEDIAPGGKVRVTEVDGTILVVVRES